ncbi:MULTISPECIES: hypothetical protein [Streptomyces]|uniref:Uncharacterized protein n=1 Tax=Streptomyces cinereoruber TaxID=67260 RepID=A0AAV4KI29_9ACTN|nr:MULTISPECIES: hypothetical protein [Streptomyces]AVH99148.1 hypothetical protein C5L38_32265 [Streptomyces sp. WAC00288]KYG50948.1 hypothetical protein AWI43_34350 [Streptomyces sp. WAC04657]MBB4158950.1 hypothetical protein [Streptomyces cinereoruber]MBY8816675.1 hypothetical protein [Streptomyces cinereoruber]NIH65118.1 hypothetical protein [Streptomyces cinereoruber]
MTTFVITVPGTFTSGITDSERSALERELSPQHTDVSESEGLDLLTLNEGGTFSVRLEVEAPDRYEAELDAVRIVSEALGKAGVAQADAPLGPPTVTGIDSDL